MCYLSLLLPLLERLFGVKGHDCCLLCLAFGKLYPPFSLVGVAISFPRRMVADKVNYCVLLLCNISKFSSFVRGVV